MSRVYTSFLYISAWLASLAEPHGFIMWPRCVHLFFFFLFFSPPLLPFALFLIGRLATRGFVFCQQARGTSRRPPLIGTDRLSGKKPGKSPRSHRPRGGWKSPVGWCRKTRGLTGGGGGAHVHKADHRGLCRKGPPNNGPCVCTCGVSSQIRRSRPPLPPRAPSHSSSSAFSLSLHPEASCPDERQSR